MNLPARKDVPVELTWDLSAIYPNEAAWQVDVDRMQALVEQLVSTRKGKLTDTAAINACLHEWADYLALADVTGRYFDLAVAVDYGNNDNQEKSAAIGRIIADCNSRLSFIKSELSALPDAVLQAAADEDPDNRVFLTDLLRQKAHLLHPEAERTLAALTQTLQTPYQVYTMTKFADMQFDPFTVNGKTYPLGYSLFEDDYEYEEDTDLRRAAFRAFSAKLSEYRNVTAAAYNAQVQCEATLSRLRGYPSVFESLLAEQKVPLALYHRQIDLITERLAPHMRRYARLLQRLHGLDRMTFADLKIAVDPDFDPRVSIEESRQYITQGLSVMGEDYVAMLEQAYRERWIDFAKNRGKSTGGFCDGPYGRHAYILLNWNERMSDVFTLAHELGHAGHFKAYDGLSYLNTYVSLYPVEAPSTINELLLAHYLLKTNDDPRYRRWVLSSMIGHTYYHNFVTHLMEAAYQREVYRIVDAGGSVTADTLCALMKQTLQRFWGDAVEIDDDAALTWMRQPHYYIGLYSYTYSAGLTIATQMCKRIEAEGQPAVEDWKRVLAAGGTLDPVSLAALAGIDITTDAPLLDTIDYIGSIIDEIIKLSE